MHRIKIKSSTPFGDRSSCLFFLFPFPSDPRVVACLCTSARRECCSHTGNAWATARRNLVSTIVRSFSIRSVSHTRVFSFTACNNRLYENGLLLDIPHCSELVTRRWRFRVLLYMSGDSKPVKRSRSRSARVFSFYRFFIPT